jgi:threonine aldolase
MSDLVDLRSDTVTRPTAAMRAAMAAAEVGDDVFGEDPTVNRLQEVFADVVGTEAALFVPSGTMGNQLCLRLLTEPGDEVVVGREQHLVRWEEGASEVNARVRLTLVDDADGTITVPDGSTPALICIEDTHLGSGGRPWPEAALRRIGAADGPVHLDGARLWHAAVAAGTSPAERVAAAGATTVTCCLSKALGAPVGSVVGMPAAMLEAARRERRRLGGAMRQAGVLAAAGLVALEDHHDRLAADHARARRLAEACAERWPGSVDPATVSTNIVLAEVGAAAEVCRLLLDGGVLGLPFSPTTLRLVTHGDVDDRGIDRAVAALRRLPPTPQLA